MKILYKCSKECSLRAVRHVPDEAGGPGTLLAAEMLLDIPTKSMNYYLVVCSSESTSAAATSSTHESASMTTTATAKTTSGAAAATAATAATATPKGTRFELRSAPTNIDTGRFVQIAFVPAHDSLAVQRALESDLGHVAETAAGSVAIVSEGGEESRMHRQRPPMVFCGVCKCGSLDVFFVDAPGACRQMKSALKLPFSQFCFTSGVCDGVCARQILLHSTRTRNYCSLWHRLTISR